MRRVPVPLTEPLLTELFAASRRLGDLDAGWCSAGVPKPTMTGGGGAACIEPATGIVASDDDGALLSATDLRPPKTLLRRRPPRLAPPAASSAGGVDGLASSSKQTANAW